MPHHLLGPGCAKAFLSVENALENALQDSKDSFSRWNQRRRRVTRLAHPEGDPAKRETGRVGKDYKKSKPQRGDTGLVSK
jgi:hypothetical protein